MTNDERERLTFEEKTQRSGKGTPIVSKLIRWIRSEE